MRIIKKLLAFLAAFSMLLAGSLGFSGSGSGTSNDPYEISTCSELQEMQDDLTAYYELLSNIDCSGTSSWNYNSSLGVNQGFDPVGGFENQFDGELNGNNYQIDSLYIKRNETDYVGLIGYLGSEGYVYNLTINNADVNGSSRVGAVIGYSRGNSSNLSSSGSIEGIDNVGGLIGYLSEGKLNLSASTADVSGGDKRYDSLGGLTGSAQYAQISKSYFEGTVTGQGKGGGISGYAYESNINFSYTNGVIDVSGDDAGGLTGDNGNIFNSYSHSVVEIDSGSVGGISGNTGGKVYNSFSTGTVTDTQNSNNIGGAIGDEFASPDYNNLYWDTQSSGVSTSSGGTGLTTSEMQGLACEMIGLYPQNWVYRSGDYPELKYFNSGSGISGQCDPVLSSPDPTNGEDLLEPKPNLSIRAGDRNKDSLNVTFFDAGDDSIIAKQNGLTSEERASTTWEFLSRGQTHTWYAKVDDGQANVQGSDNQFYLANIAGGNGSQDNPYEISSCQHLQNMNIDTGTSYSEIDLYYELVSDIDCSSFSGFEPVGSQYGNFWAALNGRNHTVDGLTIYKSAESAALIENNQGYIKNIGLTNADITGHSGSGVIAGTGSAYINESFATGTVDGTYDTSGYNSGYPVGLGGILGSGGTPFNTYADVDITDGDRRYGGLTGDRDVKKSYSIGQVEAGDYAYGALMPNDAYETPFSYYDKDAAGIDTGGGVGYSTSQVQGGSAVCNMYRFDFEDTWVPLSGDYPELERFTSQSGVDLSTLNCPPLRPRNGGPSATGKSSVPLKIYAYDQDADDMDISFYNAADDSQIGNTQQNIPDEGSASVTWNVGRGSHKWYSKAVDEDGQNQSITYDLYRFAGGNGTSENPFEIENCRDLQAISYDSDASYELTEDIDCSDTRNWNNGDGFKPIGVDSVGEFTGNLFGRNNSIVGLHITDNHTEYGNPAALFTEVKAAKIKNLGLENINITTTNGENAAPFFVEARRGRYLGNDRYERGLLDSVYATGNIEGDGAIAGLIYEWRNFNISNSYTMVDMNSTDGDLYGTFHTGDDNSAIEPVSLKNSFTASNMYPGPSSWDESYSLYSYCNSCSSEDAYYDISITEPDDNSTGTKLTTSQMTDNAAPAYMAGFDFGSKWETVVDHPHRTDHPALKWQDLGNGSAEDPYRITTCEQLQEMKNDLQAYYILERDIDCARTSSWNGGKGFDPVGNESYPFRGGLDGNGSKVENLYIDRSEDKVGLFGETSGSLLENISLESVSVTGNSDVGGIAGLMDAGSEINSTYVNGTIKGSSNVGGIAGNIETSEIKESYVILELQGGDTVGGLAGVNNISVVNESFSAAEITSGTNLGGLIGQDSSGTVEAGYWDQEKGPSNSAGGKGLNTTDIQGCSAPNHLANLDFVNIWDARDSYYPVFRWKGLGDSNCAVMNWTSPGNVDGFKIYDNSTGSFTEIADVPETAQNGDIIDGWIETPSSGYICYEVTAYVKPYTGTVLESNPSSEVCRNW